MKSKGFSLIEMLIVLVIISILSNFAYTSYNHHLIKTRRADAQVALQDLAIQLEHFYLENNQSFVGASFAKLQISDHSPHDYYQLEIRSTTSDGFVVAAVAEGVQTNDDDCKVLTLDDKGKKIPQDCW